MGLGGRGPLRETPSAIDPTPTASRNIIFPQGPAAQPTSRECVEDVDRPDSNDSRSPSMPSERAMLLAVPIGKIAIGVLRSRNQRTALPTVPSPPARITASQRFDSASFQSACLVEK